MFIDPSYTVTIFSTSESIDTNVTQENNFTHLTVSDVAPYDSLVLYMPFDVSGTTQYDYSVNENDGTVTDAVFNSSGKYGGAYEFDGNGDRVGGSGSGIGTIGTGNYTVSAWVYKKDSVTAGIVAFDDYDPVWAINVDEHMYVYDSTYKDNSTGTVALDSWQHITYVRYNTSAGGMKYYINGVYDSSATHDDSIGAVTNFEIGADRVAGGEFDFNGSIDEVMVFNRSLNSTEISDLYNKSYSRFYPTGTEKVRAVNITNSTNWDNDGYNRVNLSSTIQEELNSSIEARVGQINSSVNVSGQVLYMPFEWGSAVDISGEGNDGTVTDAVFNVSGGVNDTGGFEFDGAGDYVDCGNDASLNITDMITIEAWVKPASFKSTQFIAGKRSGGTNVWQLGIADNTVYIGIWPNDGVEKKASYSNGTPTADVFYHIVGVANGSNVTIYVNGVGVVGQAYDGTIRGFDDVSVYIANTEDSHQDRFFNGTIDEFQIWNRSLSEDEIQTLYNESRDKHNNIYYTDYQNITSDTNETFTINTEADYIFPEYKFLAGNSSSLFYSPVLYNDISLEVFTVDTVYPKIGFVSPTLVNDTSTTNTSIEINVSINETYLDEVKWNWNGTNYTIFNDSLVLMMNFDNVSALGENDTLVVDISGRGNNGMVVGGNTTTADGKYQRAMMFDGDNDYVDLPNIVLSNSWTMETWIKRSAGSDTKTIIDLNDGTNICYLRVGEFTANAPSFVCSGNLQISPSTPDISDGKWHHVVGIRDGSDAYMYVDGTEAGSDSTFSTSSFTSTQSQIGRELWGGTQYFPWDGFIDEVRIYNRSLSADEVSQMYMSNLNKYDTDKWTLYVNQSKNATDSLDAGTYTYFASAKDTNENENVTEVRTVSVEPFKFHINTTASPQNFSFQTDNALNLIVDWGDGNSSTYNGTGLRIHEYATAGDYNVSLTGYVNGVSFYEGTPTLLNDILTPMSNSVTGINSSYQMFRDASGITSFTAEDFFDGVSGGVTNMSEMFYNSSAFNQSLNNWNTSSVTTMSRMFRHANVFNGNISNWNTSSVTNMSTMFQYADVFNQSLNNWDTSSVTDMRYMFVSADIFNGNISNWDTSSVTDMHYIFAYASAFNGNISNWNTSSAIYMGGMFCAINAFNQSLDNWDTSSATDMGYMFYNVDAFNQDIGGWNVSAVTRMSGMFYDADAFNQSLNDWDTSSVTSMSQMFYSAGAFNGNISNWNTSSVTNMGQMFYFATAFNGNISNWDTSSVTKMNNMFYYANSFNGNISNWDTSSVEDMDEMFRSASIFNQPLNNWNTSSVTDMSYMFYNADAFNQSLSNWNTPNVTNMKYMFYGTNVFNGNISNWDTSNVANMDYMFYGANAFNQPLNSWNTSNVTNMSYMFYNADAFNQSLNSWNTFNVTSMYAMFRGANVFNGNISNWNTSSVTDMSYMFYGANAFNQDIGNWNVSTVTKMNDMFRSATVFNQDIGGWDVSKVDDMDEMFENAIAFDQNLSSWNVSAVTDMTEMFNGATLSVLNYDSLLMGWASLTPNLQGSVPFHGGNSKYSIAANASRNGTLIGVHSWSITDGGLGGAPTYSLNQTNSTIAGQSTLFSIQYDDDAVLHPTGQYIFSTNNTGTWANESAVNFTATPSWANVSKILNSSVGVSVGYRWYADDNVGDVNNTGVFVLTTTDGVAPEIGFVSPTLANDTSTTNTSIEINVSINESDLNEVKWNWNGTNYTLFNDSLTVMYNFDNLSALGESETKAVDVSEYSEQSNATLSSASIVTGKYGKAVDLDGSSTTITPASPDPGIWHDAFTKRYYGVWIKADSTAGDRVIVDEGGSTNGFCLMISSGKLVLNVQDDNQIDALTYDYTDTTNWHYVVVGYNVTDIFMYVDGELVNSSGTPVMADSEVSTHSDEPGIGYTFGSDACDHGSTGNYFNGSIDEFKMWERELSASEVSQLYMSNLNKYDSDKWTLYVNQSKNATDVLDAGTYTYFASARDDAGNENLTEVRTVTVEPFKFKVTTTASPQNFSFQTDNAVSLFVDWGDGNDDTYSGTGLRSHEYVTAGDYNVSLTGYVNGVSFYEGTPTLLNDILTPMSNSVTGINSSYQMFRDASGITSFTAEDWFDDVSGGVTTIGYMFYGATAFNQSLNSWNTSSVTNMYGTFFNTDVFNGDISNWNTSSVTSMSYMFADTNVFNGNISNWDTSKVTVMKRVFYNSYIFNKSLNNWDTSKVTDMSSMFHYANVFNGNISNWNTSSVTNMSQMFYNADAFNQSLNNWNTSSVTDMSAVFGYADVFNGNISNWDTSSVTDMGSMFDHADLFNGNISNWDTSSVTDMSHMFNSATAFNGNTSNWNTSSVTDMGSMFHGASAFNQSLSNWDTSKVISIGYMFCYAIAFNQPLNNWNTSSVIDMGGVFYSADVFNQPLNNWNTSSVVYMHYMFNSADVFNSNISNWDTSSVTNMRKMFSYTDAFNGNISTWDTSNVITMRDMFYNADVFNSNISNWNTSSVTAIEGMFHGANVFNGNISNWDTSSVTNMSEMFYDAIAFEQNLSSWNVSAVTDMTNMFNGVTLSTANYDSLLTGWAGLTPNLQGSVPFHGGSSKYSISANASRNGTLIGVHSWVITDGGFDGYPTYSLIKKNNTLAGQSTLFSIYWDDDVALHPTGQYIFSTNNTGVWANESAVNFTATPSWANVTKTLNDTTGVSVGYMWYATDNVGNWNDTGIHTLVVDPFRFNINTTASPQNFSFKTGNAVDLNVDWGDGNDDTYNGTGLRTHEYAMAGEYNVSLTGYVNRVSFYEGTPTLLKDILTPMSNSLTGINGSNQMFRSASGITTFTAEDWFDDVSGGVTTMYAMFYDADAFNQSLNNWNTSSVTTMGFMFNGAKAFNGNISNWDTSSITAMGYMFNGAKAFNGNVSNWNTSSVTDMGFMFYDADAFNKPLSNWDTSNVTNMMYMFSSSAFNQPLNNWNTSNVKNMQKMFSYIYSFNQPLNNWDTSSVTDMNGMFRGVNNFNGNVSNWNTSSVTDMNHMFSDANNFNGNISNWDTSNVTNMIAMFYSANVFNQSLSNWNTSSVTTMNSMFCDTNNFNGNISNWDTSNVTKMNDMFRSATVFNQDIGGWDVSKVDDMNEMFESAVAFEQNLSSWNVSAVTNMTEMFNGVTLSTANYDSLLVGWAGLTPNLQGSVPFHGGSSKYSIVANASRNGTLIGVHSWSIT
ncbi:BspA family leucine-rich repeat surface protein, partial [Candidatus Pacearchaeota archaeon]|nr:BspA family leucine-rich repeat surface protein [Candidatus Pacearchaeota archaeon]